MSEQFPAGDSAMSGDRRSMGRDEAAWSTILPSGERPLKSEFTSPPVAGQLPPDLTAVERPLSESLPWREASTPDPWVLAQQHQDDDVILELIAHSFNKGGLLVEWKGLPGFVPASQLTDFPHFHLKSERLRELERRQGQTLQLKIIEIDAGRNRLILSERAAQVASGRRDAVLSAVQIDDRVQGQVTNLTPFGAFVDLGGVEGLIHISELSWRRVTHPSDIVQPGQTVEALVLETDKANGRVALSLKRLQRDPWLTVEERYRSGQAVTGIVSNVVHFGAFVLLEAGLEGLIHISELSNHKREVERGAEVVAEVLQVNGAKRRLSLRLKSVQR